MDSPKLTPVSPTRPPAAYLGGKRNLAKRICAILDRLDCKTYAEPFVGMGGIFLRRTRRPTSEVINDRGRDVANLFRILQRHYPQFLDVLRFQLTTRAEFERLRAVDPDRLTDLERAARFLYIQRTVFGGQVGRGTFGVSKLSAGRFNLTTLVPLLDDLHERLAGVVIECLDYADFIRRYDGPDTVFYLDPPYWGCEDDYGKAIFERADFDRIAGKLGTLQGRFLLSINDVPEIRTSFAAFRVTPIQTRYQVQGGGGAPAAELLISNFDIGG